MKQTKKQMNLLVTLRDLYSSHLRTYVYQHVFMYLFLSTSCLCS